MEAEEVLTPPQQFAAGVHLAAPSEIGLSFLPDGGQVLEAFGGATPPNQLAFAGVAPAREAPTAWAAPVLPTATQGPLAAEPVPTGQGGDQLPETMPVIQIVFEQAVIQPDALAGLANHRIH